MRRVMGLSVVVAAVVLAGGYVLAEKAWAEKSPEKKSPEKTAPEKAAERDKQALTPLQIFVGEWRGVGQPRRGSTVGSWIEESEWAWKFEKGAAAFVFATPKEKEGAGKFFVAGRLERGEKDGQFRLIGTLPDGKTQLTYTGSQEKDGRLVLSADDVPEGSPSRIALRTVAEGQRLLILYERRLGKSDNYTRLAEVGFTRKGGDFAKAVVERECVVTGGAGTIQVSYKGQSYWVCCTGCRDLFNEDPEGVLAEFRARKEAEKKKK
jgi:YHS domain-containing protein